MTILYQGLSRRNAFLSFKLCLPVGGDPVAKVDCASQELHKSSEPARFSERPPSFWTRFRIFTLFGVAGFAVKEDR
jgi:hypothetical protein